MSSDGERSPKRQRRSYSPPSPALPETKPFVHQPQTPPPSVHMSPSWQAQTSTLQQVGSVPFPTPPSTTGCFSQQRGAGSDGGESGQHTPATAGEDRQDEEGDAEMPDVQHNGEGEGEGDVSMVSAPAVEADAEHRRTDHERQEGTPSDSSTTDMLPPPPPRLYKLRTKPIAPARPHPSQNLIDLYSLQGVQASVARHDAAGNKINKLRKSYEGKVKQLGLSGRSKVHMGNGALAGLMVPDWDYDVGGGKTFWEQDRGAEFPLGNPETEQEVMGKLGPALSLRAGQLPKGDHEQWKSILGLDEPKGTPVVTATKPNGLLAASNPAFAKTAPGLRHSAPSSPGQGLGGARPERAGKKRRYDEASYSGYHEGFDDDGYSTGGDSASRRASASKRQKTGAPGSGGSGDDYWILRQWRLQSKAALVKKEAQEEELEQSDEKKFVLKLKSTPVSQHFGSEAKLKPTLMLRRLSSLTAGLKQMRNVLLSYSTFTDPTTTSPSPDDERGLAATVTLLLPRLIDTQSLLAKLYTQLDAEPTGEREKLGEAAEAVDGMLRSVRSGGAWD
ncbi:hypothetical protein B0A55_05088 [Friedmanniomyces simplex]|uniref:Mediator of RNA polymerase II transcription subunit 19 n=1 Tax=Friedmanniomyces simplex TaxID=329884 RepID=A0A4U0XJ18_9PEZI|nr:hypothetical protein B0A55_05088 [Friedmanniomyces simplex]